jgi:DNA topoisomerase-3
MTSTPCPDLQTEHGRATRRQRASTVSTPGKRVIITEKPSMGRTVAAALGATTRHPGYLEGTSDIVTWCVGHLVELDAPEAYNPAWKQWRMADLPICPAQFTYHPAAPTLDQFNVIKKLLGRTDVTTIVNAADAGREGELIFDLVYTLARCRKPVERLWISSLTREAILAGFRNLKPATVYRGLRDSARCRQQADWLVGLNATRAQTIRARHAGADGVYSLGRVQTPTLALIVARDQEIAAFVPVEYYEVVATFQASAGSYHGLWGNAQGTRFATRAAAAAITAKVQGRLGTVVEVEKQARRERPPLLYDLTSLQQAANTRYAFSAAHTLSLAQSLYEKTFITYPRTASRHLSSSVNRELRGHVEAASVGPYLPFIRTILARGTVTLTPRHVDDKKVTDHHAIIPAVQRVDPAVLSPDEKRLYDRIARRFLAGFYPDAELERTTLMTEVEGERFTTRGTVVLAPGWHEVDPPRRGRPATDDAAEAVEALPPVRVQDAVETRQADTLTKHTKPPPRYSDATLLGAMETAGKTIDDEDVRLAMKDAGLGTPATRAAIIETLLTRAYVVRDKKSLVATPKGLALVRSLRSPLLTSAELTGQWEQKLARMARDEYACETFMCEVRDMVDALVAQIAGTAMEPPTHGGGLQRTTALRPAGALDCPKCMVEGRAEGFLSERAGATGKFLVCATGRDVCGFITDKPKNARQRKALQETRCPICQSAMRLRLSKDKARQASLSCCTYPNCQGVRWFDSKGTLEKVLTFPETGPPCPTCGTLTVKRGPTRAGHAFWACPRWRRDGSGCTTSPIWINSTRP